MRPQDQIIHTLLDDEATPEERQALLRQIQDDPSAMARLRAFQVIVEAIREPPQSSLSPDFAGRVAGRLKGTDRRSARWRRVWSALWAPRLLRWNAGCAAVVVLLIAVVGAGLRAAWNGQVSAGSRAEPAVYVRFALHAPEAKSVTLAGDFNGWNTRDISLTDPDRDGVWTVTVPVRPGVHQYMFVIDGDRWATDPWAGAYVEDGFGNRNAVLRTGGVLPKEARDAG